MIDARDLRSSATLLRVRRVRLARGGDHPIYVYTLGSAPTRGRGVHRSTGVTGRACTAYVDRRADPRRRRRTTRQSVLERPGHRTAAIAVLPTTRGGYVLDGFGGLHPFGIGGTPRRRPRVARTGTAGTSPAARAAPTARAATCSTASAGSTRSRRHSGTPPATRRWPVLERLGHRPRHRPRRGNGGYMLDGFGGLHPFEIGTGGTKPAAPSAVPYWNGVDMARGSRSSATAATSSTAGAAPTGSVGTRGTRRADAPAARTGPAGTSLGTSRSTTDPTTRASGDTTPGRPGVVSRPGSGARRRRRVS